jgi:hypothetical protein
MDVILQVMLFGTLEDGMAFSVTWVDHPLSHSIVIGYVLTPGGGYDSVKAADFKDRLFVDSSSVHHKQPLDKEGQEDEAVAALLTPSLFSFSFTTTKGVVYKGK